MAIVDGFKKFKQARAQAEAARASFVRVPELRFKETPTVRGWFNGGGEEPLLRAAHRISQGNNRYPAWTCAGDGCRLCERSAAGDRRVARVPTDPDTGAVLPNRGALNFVDALVYHRVQKVDDRGKPVLRTKDREPFMVDVPCKGTGCRHCERKVARARGGQKVLDLAGMFIESLVAQVDEIRQFCRSCWAQDPDERGRVEAVGWRCDECSNAYELAVFDPNLSTADPWVCPDCRAEMPAPSEAVECSKGCTKAARVDLWSGPWSITKSGSQKTTAYAFAFQGVQPRPEWVEAYDPIDLAAAYRPYSARKVDELLGGRQGGYGGGGDEFADEPPPASNGYVEDDTVPF